MEKATFAAGCFWGVEEAFRKAKGVISTRVGYTGGKKQNPSYEDVCTDTTGHAEAVEVTFDPDRTNFQELLKLFWDIHDPTLVNRQGPDVGTQYRSAIFYHNDQQKLEALRAIKSLKNSGRFKRDIATEVSAASTFWQAEEYHQKYLQKKGLLHCSKC